MKALQIRELLYPDLRPRVPPVPTHGDAVLLDRCVRVNHAGGLQSAIGSIRRSGAAPDECSIGRYAECFE